MTTARDIMTGSAEASAARLAQRPVHRSASSRGLNGLAMCSVAPDDIACWMCPSDTCAVNRRMGVTRYSSRSRSCSQPPRRCDPLARCTSRALLKEHSH